MIIVDLDGLKKLMAQYQGKVVFIDFWATWCGPCVKGLPDLAKMQEKYGARGFQAIPVSFDDPKLPGIAGKMRQTLDQAGWREKTIVARDQETRKAIAAWLDKEWKGEALPAQYVIDRKGQAAYELIGGPPDKMERLEKVFEQLFGPAKAP